MSVSAEDLLRAQLDRHGLHCTGAIVADGKLHRFKAQGDSARNSWYVLHAGPPTAGAFGCWKRGIKETWFDRKTELLQTQWNVIRKQWQAADIERRRVEEERRDKARDSATRLYDRAQCADVSNSYLTAKTVKAFGDLRQFRNGKLIVPLRDVDGRLHSLQFIRGDGEKRFLAGGRIMDCWFTVADKTNGPLVLCEGYATGAGIHEATNFATVCAMNSGNLLAVAQTLRNKWPDREIIIAADNDQWTDGNPGVTKATEAAKAIHEVSVAGNPVAETTVRRWLETSNTLSAAGILESDLVELITQNQPRQ
jgi:putative DNA primase/helicase